jgi:hypothetical protein
MVGFGEHYRVAWGGVMGGMELTDTSHGVHAGDAIQDNLNPWSGDHASNSPALVTGIFFSSDRLNLPRGGVSVMHLAPTLLHRLGVTIPASLPLAPLTR